MYGLVIYFAVEALWLIGYADHAAAVESNLREKVLRPDFRAISTDARLSLARLCALTGRYEEASHWFAESRAVLDEQGARPLRAISDYDEALMWVRHAEPGDAERAHPILETALAQFRALGMPGWERRALDLRNRAWRWPRTWDTTATPIRSGSPRSATRTAAPSGGQGTSSRVKRAFPAHVREPREIGVQCQYCGPMSDGDRGDPGVRRQVSAGAGATQEFRPEPGVLLRLLNDAYVRVLSPAIHQFPCFVDRERSLEEARLRSKPQEGVYDDPGEPDGAFAVDRSFKRATSDGVVGQGGAHGREQDAGVDDPHEERASWRRIVSSSSAAATALAFVTSNDGRPRSRVFCRKTRWGRFPLARLLRRARFTTSESVSPSSFARVLS
jgi:hypothetical protein